MNVLHNQIMLGDCLDKLQNIPTHSVDLILTDPPYGTTRCAWDIPIDLVALWREYERVIKSNGAILVFAQAPYDKILASSNIKLFRYEWIWEKTEATGHLNAKKMPLKAHENILVFYKNLPTYNPQMSTGHKPVNSFTRRPEVNNKTPVYGKVSKTISGGGSTERYPRSVLRFAKDKQKTKGTDFAHPTQKPLALCEYLIKTYTNPGDVVLDTFAGSGTIGLAAKNTSRSYILIEKEEQWYNSCLKRITNSITSVQGDSNVKTENGTKPK
jgi:DNA modification methylase